MTCADCAQLRATLDRLTAQVDTFALAAAKGRIRELEESLDRINRAQPRKAAAELASVLAEMDPRSNDGEQSCFFCCKKRAHREDCVWKRAVVIAEQHRRDLRKQLVREWTS